MAIDPVRSSKDELPVMDIFDMEFAKDEYKKTILGYSPQDYCQPHETLQGFMGSIRPDHTK